MSNQKSKEFYVSMCDFDDKSIEIYDCKEHYFEKSPPAQTVHVIEYSAYQEAVLQAVTAKGEAQELMDKIKDLEQHIDAMNDSALKTEGDLRKEIKQLKQQIEQVLEAVQEHAFSGNIIDSSYLHDKIDEVLGR